MRTGIKTLLFYLLLMSSSIISSARFSMNNDTHTKSNIFINITAIPQKSYYYRPLVIYLDKAYSKIADHIIKIFATYTKQTWQNHLASCDPSGLNRPAHLWSQEERNLIFKRYDFYQFPAFREYIATLPGYHEAIISIHEHIMAHKEFAKKLNKIAIHKDESVKDFIGRQVVQSEKIVQQKHEELLHKQYEERIRQEQAAMLKQQQEALAIHKQQVIATIQTQQEDLDTIVHMGQSIARPKTHLEQNICDRSHAIQATTDKNFSMTTEQYIILSPANALLDSLKLNVKDFTQCHGNAIQQHIHKEIVTSVNRLGNLYQRYGQNAEIEHITRSAAEFAHVGIMYNNAGYVTHAMTLSDLVSAFGEYGSAYGAAFLCGLGDGVIESARHVAEVVKNPIDTAVDLAHTAATVGYYLGKFCYEALEIRVLYVINPCAANEKAVMHLDAMLKNIEAVRIAIGAKWQNKSGTEIVRDATATLTTAAIDTFLTKKSLGAAEKFFRYAKGKSIDLVKKIKQGAAPELLASAEGLEVLIAHEAAETVMYSTTESAAAGGAASKANKISAACKVMHEPIVWEALDPALGDLTKIREAETWLKSIPQYNPSGNVLATKHLKNHPLVRLVAHGERGALYEAEAAVILREKGKNVLEFGRTAQAGKISAREFDIITQDSWIECKDWTWERLIDADINTAKGTFQQQKLIAEAHNVSFEIYSKKPIPDFWKQLFTEMNIIFHEGSL
jgi:hypothetical protein